MSTSTMQAWVYRSKGDPSKILALEPDYPRPIPSGDQILLKVSAVSLNPVGWKLISLPPLNWMTKTPGVPECDVSGTIVEGNLEGSDLKVGDQVFGIKTADKVMKTGQGVLAEYCLVEKERLRRKPTDLEFEKAAAVPLATLTALGALVDTAGIKRENATGKKVFINGGSGGVGQFAVQIATAHGCQVSTTCSSSSRSLVESLSSNIKIFDYTSSPLTQQLKDFVGEDKKPFDVIFDTIGVPELYHASPSYLSAKGLYIDIAGPHLDGSILNLLKSGAYLISSLLRPSWLGGTPRKYKFYGMNPSEETMNEMERLVSDGSLTPVIDEVFAFEDAKKAYERSMSGRAKGKVVVRVA